MELDDLLEREGLDAQSVEQTLEWARDRAQQLVQDVGTDPELGPLLDQAVPVSGGAGVSTPVQAAPPPPPPEPVAENPAVPELIQSAEASEEGDLFESSELRVPLDAGMDSPVQAEAQAPVEAEDEVDVSIEDEDEDDGETEAAPAEAAEQVDEVEAAEQADAPAEPEAPAEPDPLADMDFDNLPGADEDEPALDAASEDAAPEAVDESEPSQVGVELTEQLTAGDAAPESVEEMVTAPAEISPSTEQTVAGGDEEVSSEQEEDEEDIEEIEEIELLDDDDLELVEEDEDEDEGQGPAESEPAEWAAALASAQLGGGDQADADSGLLKPAELAPIDTSETDGPAEG
ncbi:MAG: hypothetical protein AAF799_03640 [Myxococcota bacterium]